MLGSNASAFETALAVPDVHKVLCSAAEMACKEQDFYVGDDCGSMIPILSKICQAMRQHFQILLESRSEIINIDSLSYKELSAVGKRVRQSSALVSPTTTLNRDAVPCGDVGESRVEGNEEAAESGSRNSHI